MAKAARCLSFALKAAQPFGVAAHFRRQHLDRHAIAQQNVPRTIDSAHSAFAEHAFNLILTVENTPYQRRRILFQDLAVLWTKAQTVVKFFFADLAVLHSEISLQRINAVTEPPVVRTRSGSDGISTIQLDSCDSALPVLKPAGSQE